MPENTPYQPLSIQEIGANARQLIDSSPGYWKNWKNDLYREYVMQQATAEQQNAFNVAMWNAENEYNSPVNQMRRFQQAGLNPNLIYGQQNTSASAPSASGGVNFNVAGHRKNQLSKNQATANQLMETAGMVNTIANTLNNLETAKQNRLYTNQLTAKAAIETARAQFAYDQLDGLRGQGILFDNKMKMQNYIANAAKLQYALYSMFGDESYSNIMHSLGDSFPQLNWFVNNDSTEPSKPSKEGQTYRDIESQIQSRLASAFSAFASGSLHNYQRDIMGPEQLRALKALGGIREKEDTIKSVTADAIEGYRTGDFWEAISNGILLFVLGEIQ